MTDPTPSPRSRRGHPLLRGHFVELSRGPSGAPQGGFFPTI